MILVLQEGINTVDKNITEYEAENIEHARYMIKNFKTADKAFKLEYSYRIIKVLEVVE